MTSQLSNSDQSEQIISLAKKYAGEIISGAVTPYEGGRRIWKECYRRLEAEDHRLDPFVYWADEYEDTSSRRRRALCDKGLRHAAVALLEKGSAV